MKRLVIAALVSLLFAVTAGAQLGTISFPSSGKPEAQPAFLRGVAALHSFWYEEAAEAFREAQKIDPGFALAYWGEAMTYNHPIWMEVDLDAGRKVLARLGATREERLRKAPTPRERGFLEAVEALYGEGDKAARDLAYDAAMQRLADSHPNDIEAQAFRALAILGLMKPGQPDARKQVRTAAILEPLLPANPDHPGILHYLIHAYDDPVHAPLGLRAARRYAEVAPAAFHALHMPSHIFLQLGMWNETVASNERSYGTSKTWVEAKKLPRVKRDLHSLQWLHYGYLQQKRFDEAKKLVAEIPPAEGESERERWTRGLMQARYAIETGDWSSLPSEKPQSSGATEEHAGCASKIAVGNSAPLLFAMGLAAVERGDQKQAAVWLKELRASGKKSVDYFQETSAAVMTLELEAMMSERAGKLEQALELAAKAVEAEKALGDPSGPPDNLKPAHELYAEMLARAGRPDDAAKQFAISLLRTPNRRLSLEGAAKLQTR